jgi:DNA invertase Pin-like site-specific DNA recombinase
MQKQFVAYYRVSTTKQGVSGLGLEAQRATVNHYVDGRGTILSEYTEIESGKKSDRQQLALALAEAKRVGATLLIAKLDRLSRNVGFIFALRDSGVDFTCCDIPDANTLTVGLFAVIAQHERETISKRTVDALAALKARGVKLGNPQNLTDAARAKSIVVRTANAKENKSNLQAAQLAALWKREGRSLQGIADNLNKSGYQTRTGKQFFAKTVQRLLNA